MRPAAAERVAINQVENFDCVLHEEKYSMDRDEILNLGIEADENEDFELAQACEDALSGGLAEYRYLENVLFARKGVLE